MSSCLKVTFTLDGTATASLERIGGFTTTVTRAADMTAWLEREGGLRASITRKDGMSCKLWQVCSTSIREPFLEISPTIVWVLAGYASNDVYSNTTWYIQ